MSNWVLEMFIVEDSFSLEHHKIFGEVLHLELGAGYRFTVTRLPATGRGSALISVLKNVNFQTQVRFHSLDSFALFSALLNFFSKFPCKQA